MKFFKNGCNGGGGGGGGERVGEIFTRNWKEAKNMGVGFIMGEWENFGNSLHSWQRGATLPRIYEDSLSSFSNFVEDIDLHMSSLGT